MVKRRRRQQQKKVNYCLSWCLAFFWSFVTAQLFRHTIFFCKHLFSHFLAFDADDDETQPTDTAPHYLLYYTFSCNWTLLFDCGITIDLATVASLSNEMRGKEQKKEWRIVSFRREMKFLLSCIQTNDSIEISNEQTFPINYLVHTHTHTRDAKRSFFHPKRFQLQVEGN